MNLTRRTVGRARHQPPIQRELINGRRPTPTLSPEHRLLIGMLLTAISDAAGRACIGDDYRDRAGLRDCARAWFASPSNAPFSFRWVAQQFGRDPDAAQREIWGVVEQHGNSLSLKRYHGEPAEWKSRAVVFADWPKPPRGLCEQEDVA